MVEWQDNNSSSISCRSCRSRKVKWYVRKPPRENGRLTALPSDRQFPNCLVCEKTSQVCSYPPGPSRPGPKVGQRKRCIEDTGDGSRHTAKPRLESQNKASVSVMGRPGSNSSADNERPLLDGPGDYEAPTVEAKVPDLSFILHPSHESSGPNNDAILEQQPTGECHQKAAFDGACSALGLSRVEVEKL